MGVTSELAREFLQWELENAKKNGPDMVSYVTEQALQDFNSSVFANLIEATYSDLSAKFDEIGYRPVVSEDASILLEQDVAAFELTDSIKAIAFKRPSMDCHILLAWETGVQSGKDTAIIRLFGWKAGLPLDRREELEAHLAVPVASSRELIEVYKAYDKFAFADFASHGLVKFPSLSGLLRSIKDKGVEKAKGICYGAAYIFNYEDQYKIRARHTGNGWKNDTAAITLVKEFIAPELSHVDLFNSFSDLGQEFETVDLKKIRQSLAALNIEDKMFVFEKEIQKMFEASTDLVLSNEVSFAYNDTDIKLNLFKSGDKALYFHNNVDLFEQKVFVFAFKEKNGKFESVDFHLCQTWQDNSDENWEVDGNLFKRFADSVYFFEDSDLTISQDEFLQQIKNGDRPGLMGSYNFETKEFAAGPFFEKSAFLNSLANVIENDHKALCRVPDEDGDVRSCEIQQRPENSKSFQDMKSYELDEWLAVVQGSSIQAYL